MFDTQENRYLTKGVSAKLPREIQLRCWQWIDEKSKKVDSSLDYLQIFEFNPDNQRQSIEVVHRQEEPFFINYYQVKMNQSIQSFDVAKLWVIDDGTNQTMLLPEEY
ncbi:DUF960 family protein [Enterococcus sp. 22-H-5-01]|uniref:DUF960 family protein n=1 Tax=Enterococcus sp. 22-H-5-01 TaxID=3418555 RepID=UPI003CFFC5BF